MIRLPHGKLIFDTSVYIRHIREQSYRWMEDDDAVIRRLLLTVVVAAELYAGARSVDEKGHLDALCQWHQRLGTLCFPSALAWLEAGQMLGRYARVYGDLQMVNHFRDLLIALEAERNGATLVTENTRDFLRWQKLLRSTGRDLRLFDLRKAPGS
jgi:predicted nucleic acid-binding protein